MDKGWISIHRRLQDHWLWEEKRVFSKAEAWIDILFTVNHKSQKVMIKNTLLEVERGDSIMALQTWADRWKWNKSKVRRFFELLEKENMIVSKNEKVTTRLTVCKYDSYQDIRNANETQMKRKRNANETQTTPNNNDNNINNNITTATANKPSIDFNTLLDFINKNTGRSFKVINESVKSKFKARLKEGYTKEDISNTILNCVKDKFHKESNFKYLTPEYFSRSNTLDKFSNTSKGQKPISKPNKITRYV